MSEIMVRAATVEPQHTEPRLWRADRLDPHLVGLTEPTSFAADQYRTLRHLVQRREAPRQLIAVTSAAPGDGKTTTALNLAAVFAHAPDAGVLVIDLDLRAPSVAQRLGLPRSSPGFADLLLDPALTLQDVVWRHPTLPLSAVPAGRPVSMPYELLQSPRLHAVMAQLRQRYDPVILDVPPALLPESRLIADHVDGFVMVVAAQRTPRGLLGDALNAMDPVKVFGIVFNQDDRLRDGYRGRGTPRGGGRPEIQRSNGRRSKE